MSLSSDKLKGKTCIVTGAAKSIGLRIATKYAQSGAFVILIDINPEVEEAAFSLMKKGFNTRGIILDITNRDRVLECFYRLSDEFGGINVLVNNAGAVDQRPFEENTEEVLDRMFKVNVYGTAYCTQGVIPGMKRMNSGKIINFSSKSGKTGSALMGPYSSAKGAVITLTQALALEYAKYNIKINAVCPGITDATGVWSNVSSGYIKNLNLSREEVIKQFTSKVPLGRLTEIEDVVDFVFFLTVSGDYCTGQAFNITGGREMH